MGLTEVAGLTDLTGLTLDGTQGGSLSRGLTVEDTHFRGDSL